MGKNYWIWYPGDFELYHGMKQNFSRVERGYGWPAFWKSEGFRNRVAFRRIYELKEETTFTVFSNSVGHVLVEEEKGDKKYPFGREITAGPGKVRISVHAGCIEAFPCIYVKGDVICSDKGWLAEDYNTPAVPAGRSKYFTEPQQTPTVWEYKEKEYDPVRVTPCHGGLLFEFETELDAVLEVKFQRGYMPIKVCCGESMEEALDVEHCYYSWQPDEKTGRCPRCAVRFAFVPDMGPWGIKMKAIHQYVDIPVKASFTCGEKRLNDIWSVAEHTFRLCSGIFFIDGVKRDKWIWSGDAYQSLFVNKYLMADTEIDQRTLVALRGNDPVTCHINTIVDYSLLWILGVVEHYQAYGDKEFLTQIYPKMKSLMEFCADRREEHGFLIGKEKDWVYIDWADMDKDGPFCAEQMLFAACWRAMAQAGAMLGREADVQTYRKEYENLKTMIQKYFWDEEKVAYIDSFTSGRKNVTRHANIFAILFDIAEEEQQEQILEHVLDNDEIPQITTPYFNFFELDVLCKKGRLQQVLDKIRTYWGGMLDRGAVTFWEQFDPEAPVEEQYDMYGDRFGKSLCHAWAASPIYFLAKYFMGVNITEAGGKSFEVTPHTEFFDSFDCTLPVGNGEVRLIWDGKELSVKTTVSGGILKYSGEIRQLEVVNE